MSVSFMGLSSSLRVDYAHEVLDLLDHAARGRIVRQRGTAVELVEAEPDERPPLASVAAQRAADLLDRDGLCRFCHGALPQASAPSAASPPASRRRACSTDTLRLRRAAT